MVGVVVLTRTIQSCPWSQVAEQAPITLEWKVTSRKINNHRRVIHMITGAHLHLLHRRAFDNLGEEGTFRLVGCSGVLVLVRMKVRAKTQPNLCL